jgi:hypothetical protein
MLCQAIVNKTKSDVNCSEFRDEARRNTTDFTRNRKMSFEELVIFVLVSLKCSTASALRRFFTNIGKSIFMTQQSLSEARSKITVRAFVRLFKLTVNTMTEHCTNKWQGYRIYAIDGSKISLPADKALCEYFGALGKDKTAPTAQGSILYDVLNDIVVDAAIEPLTTDERTLAKIHINACKSIAPDDKKLTIFDRGYASFDLIEALENERFFYLMRVKSKFNKDIDDQTEADGYVWLKQDEKRIHVRVIKFMLSSGEEEVLVTNIKDKRLGKNAFKKLYFMRWPIECKYDIVKNKLQLENFNTRTVDGIQQDFFAAMYLTNFASAAAIDAQKKIEETRKEKGNKYQYKANMNELIGILKDRFVLALAQDSADDQTDMIESILDEIKRYVTPIRPKRSVPRKSPRNSKFHHNQKANC